MPIRLDKLVAGRFSLSRRAAQEAIRNGRVDLAGARCDEPGREVEPGAAVEFFPSRPKARKVQAVMNLIEQKKGRMATEQEMAAGLKISLTEYHQWLEEIRPATFVCLDAAFNHDFDDSISQYESLADQRQEDPFDGTFRREMAQVIAERLRELPDMQRKVLALYYFEDMRLREIAEAFGLTESRICQIHAQGILAIKSFLLKYDPYFASPVTI